MTTLIQRSSAGGEITPSLYARVDTVKYSTGYRTLRNFIVPRQGGAVNRSGTLFVQEVKDSSKTVRLVPFIFNTSTTYMLEFGNLYMRVIKDGAQVTETAKNITGITQANPAVVTSGSHGYSDGDEVYITGVVGMDQVNGRNYLVASSTSNTFALQDLAGNNVDSSSFGAYSSGGTIAKVYEITTPYLEADLSDLQYVQSADVVTIVNQNYAPRNLSRTGDTSWSLDVITFAPETDFPTGVSVSSGGAGSNTYEYQVTAINDDTFEESVAGTEATQNITNITQASPAVVTIASHGYTTGDKIHIASVSGMTELNGRRFSITVLTANTFSLDDEDSSSYTAYSSGGTAANTWYTITSAAAPTSSAPHVISWTAISGASEYNIYRRQNGIFGLLGVAQGTSFSDVGADPDTTDTPPRLRNPFFGSSNYPATVAYTQQRQAFANTSSKPEKVWMSQIANFKNFSRSSPIQDDDAIEFTMVGSQVNQVRHLVDLNRLAVFTQAGEWSVEGGASGIVTPTEVNPRQYSYNGSGSLRPLIIDNNALYVQDRGSIVRDLGFDFQVDGYRGNDLTIFSAHLFDGYTIVDWAFQKIPNSIVWSVRSDGTLLGLTYLKEQQMLSWHRHDFDGGVIESVAVIPNGDEDDLYLVVKRTIDSVTKRYIERLYTRRIDSNNIKSSIFMDASISVDGTNTGSTTMTISGGTNWTSDETLTLTSSASFFLSTDVGNQIHFTLSDGTMLRFIIDAYTSATVVTGRPHKTVDSELRSTASTSWGKAVDDVYGLFHLEGEAVSVFADGFVVASPNNEAYTTLTVTNGTITLDRPYVKISVGLPFISDIETLDIDVAQAETMMDKNKNIRQLNMHVKDSRGIFAGAKPPTDDSTDPLEGLYELKTRDQEGYDDPVDLKTDVIEIKLRSEWNNNGRVFVRQVDPVPLSILSIAPTGYLPLSRG